MIKYQRSQSMKEKTFHFIVWQKATRRNTKNKYDRKRILFLILGGGKKNSTVNVYLVVVYYIFTSLIHCKSIKNIYLLVTFRKWFEL